MNKIDIKHIAQCPKCLEENHAAERFIDGLQERLLHSKEQYEIFKEVAELALNRKKSWWGRLFK